MELVTPLVHLELPVTETLRNHLWEVSLVAFVAFADFPHEPPLGIKHWLEGRHRSVLRCKSQLLKLLGVVSSLLDELGCRTDLIVALGLDVIDLLAGVVQLASALEIRLHEVNVFFIVLHVDARVANDQDAELVEALGDLLALDLSLLARASTLLGCQEDLEVNDWHFGELFADNLGASGFAAEFRLNRGLLFNDDCLFHFCYNQIQLD